MFCYEHHHRNAIVTLETWVKTEELTEDQVRNLKTQDYRWGILLCPRNSVGHDNAFYTVTNETKQENGEVTNTERNWWLHTAALTKDELGGHIVSRLKIGEQRCFSKFSTTDIRIRMVPLPNKDAPMPENSATWLRNVLAVLHRGGWTYKKFEDNNFFIGWALQRANRRMAGQDRTLEYDYKKMIIHGYGKMDKRPENTPIPYYTQPEARRLEKSNVNTAGVENFEGGKGNRMSGHNEGASGTNEGVDIVEWMPNLGELESDRVKDKRRLKLEEKDAKRKAKGEPTSEEMAQKKEEEEKASWEAHKVAQGGYEEPIGIRQQQINVIREDSADVDRPDYKKEPEREERIRTPAVTSFGNRRPGETHQPTQPARPGRPDPPEESDVDITDAKMSGARGDEKDGEESSKKDDKKDGEESSKKKGKRPVRST